MSQPDIRHFSSQTILNSWLRSPLGSLLAKPWFDRLSLKLLDRWYFPVSRMWAAARIADGSVEKFLSEIDFAASPSVEKKLGRILKQFETRRTLARQANDRWEAAFFGGTENSPEQLLDIEQERLERRHQYNEMRFKFLPLGISQKISPIKWQITTPEAAVQSYQSWLEQPQKMTDLPEDMPQVTKSRIFAGTVGPDYWLRFQSPSTRLNDVVTVRVHEPKNVDNPPTLIFGHGICVEFDHWRGLIDEVEALVEMGIRVVRPEAPSHGRRLPEGRFSGERFIATSPCGPIDHFSAAILEWAVLIDWCRSTSTGPVAVGGSSLGSMTAHLVADRAKHWPERFHPDAMILITHSRGVGDAMYRGRLSRVWGVQNQTAAAGWTPETTQKLMTLLETHGPTVVAPENVVSVLGYLDDVTPYDAGVALLDEWRVPPDNRFDWRRGHFSVPITMMRDHAPLVVFRKILERLQAKDS